jgi:hypothetical protein
MGLLIGPTPWWQANIVSACPVGTYLPDGSRIICKSGGGTAWIVAPSCTEVGATWNGTTTTQVGTKCCVCDWPALQTRLLSCGFNPSDWFVPSAAQLQNPGYICRANWDTFSATWYWSSTEIDALNACSVTYLSGAACSDTKTRTCCVRAFRCVTY